MNQNLTKPEHANRTSQTPPNRKSPNNKSQIPAEGPKHPTRQHNTRNLETRINPNKNMKPNSLKVDLHMQNGAKEIHAPITWLKRGEGETEKTNRRHEEQKDNAKMSDNENVMKMLTR